EDECRIRSLHSPQNFALLRRIALNALDRESSFHRSIRQMTKNTFRVGQSEITLPSCPVKRKVCACV
ncbi:MAG: hypothetical protein ACYT04_60930, partial [Nostoc sp.]